MTKKRIILMYISEISGHHSATLAIEKAIKTISPVSEILNINAFNYTNPISEKIVNRLYMSVIKRTPAVWDYLYDNPAIVQKVEMIKATIHKLNSPKLKNLFEKFRPDVVACTQAFPCGMVADYKKTYNSRIPLVAVLTDYIPHSYWIYDTIDYYITPSEEVSATLNKKGVPPEKMKTFGIPFDPKFSEGMSHDVIRERLGIQPHIPTILIMGGGQGLGPIKMIVKSLENVSQDIQEIVVTGTNKKLYNSLAKSIKKCRKKILLFGYANNISELMSISDVIITKPGGITTAEALSKRLPMIIVKPIPGQEASNTAYLTSKSAAIKIDDPEQTHVSVEDILTNASRLQYFRDCAGRISKPHASHDIATLLLSL